MENFDPKLIGPLVKKMGSPILNILTWIQAVCWLAIIGGIFIAIWGTWTVAWKLMLSGFILAFIVGIIHGFLVKEIKQAVLDSLREYRVTGRVSEFQQKLIDLKNKLERKDKE